MRALVPQQPYPPGATPLQRRQADDSYQRDVLGLVTFAANNDRNGFNQASARLGVVDSDAALHDISLEVWRAFRLDSANRCADAQIAHNIRERNIELSNVRGANSQLTMMGDTAAEVDSLVIIGEAIKQRGTARHMSDEQVNQQTEDMLLAAQQFGFGRGAVIDAALKLGVSANRSQSGLRDPDEANPAQDVLDAIRINAMLRSRDLMRQMDDIEQRMTGERDPRARQRLEEERAELGRELTRLMGREGPSRAESGNGGEVRIAANDVPLIVSSHMQAVIAMHTHQLDQITLSKRPPQMSA